MSREPTGGFFEPFGGWSSHDAISAADKALARLSQLGVQIPPTNRLTSARDLVARSEALNVQLGPSDWAMELALGEANRTIFEQHIIVSGLHSVDDIASVKLSRMLTGSTTPQTSGNDHARDEQAEFFAAALLGGAGFRVDLGEPDLILSKGRARLGVAVKRVKSYGRFIKRVHEAERQLENQGLHGFIIVNAELYLTDLYRKDRSADLSKALFALTHKWISRIDLEKQSSRVLAVIGLATSFRHLGSGGRALAFNLHFHPQFVTEDTPGAQRLVRDTIEQMGNTMIATIRRRMA